MRRRPGPALRHPFYRLLIPALLIPRLASQGTYLLGQETGKNLAGNEKKTRLGGYNNIFHNNE